MPTYDWKVLPDIPIMDWLRFRDQEIVVPVAPSKNDFLIMLNRITQLKTMGCWHASAAMVLSYRNIAMSMANMSSDLSTAFIWNANKGLMATDVYKFANEVGIHANQQPFSQGFGLERYSEYIKILGPLWFAGWYLWSGDKPYGRVVVLCGVSGDKILVADPNEAQPYPRWMNYEEIEDIRKSVSVPILYRANAPML